MLSNLAVKPDLKKKVDLTCCSLAQCWASVGKTVNVRTGSLVLTGFIVHLGRVMCMNVAYIQNNFTLELILRCALKLRNRVCAVSGFEIRKLL